jgi:hypothetical protein
MLIWNLTGGRAASIGGLARLHCKHRIDFTVNIEGYSMFYVYAHLRKTDRSVFYIGKGKGQRAFVKAARNKMWRSIEKKHGCLVVVLSRWPDEQGAFDEEERLINYIGIENLSNMTKGGAGAKGMVLSAGRKSKARKHLYIVSKPYRDMVNIIQGKSKKRIFTSCGKSFLGAVAVKKWMESKGISGITTHGVSRAAKNGGEHKGFLLRYKDVVFMDKAPNRSVKVGNSGGEIFDSMQSAAESMNSRGHACTKASIHGAIHGRSVTAGGQRWGLIVNGEINIVDFDRETKFKKIKRSDGVVFDSLKDAAKQTSEKKSANKNISLAARGKTKTAYGFGWEYI